MRRTELFKAKIVQMLHSFWERGKINATHHLCISINYLNERWFVLRVLNRLHNCCTTNVYKCVTNLILILLYEFV